ncbi:MAG: phasin family protein [Rhodospirillaceae bacterium]|nr:phasin family protein [Rhodospirillaceae bacterium]
MIAQDFTKVAGLEQIEAAVKTSQDTALKLMKAGKDTAQKLYKAGSDAALKGFEKSTAFTREQVEKSFPQAVGKFDEAAAFAKEGIDASVASATVAGKGFDAIADEMVAYGKKAAEASFANVKALSSIKSVQDYMEIQTGFARTMFDTAFAGATKVAELAVKTANEVAEPIQGRVAKVVEKYGKPAV